MKEILVIEDSREVRENLCEILELSQYRVRSAENGKIGLQMALSEAPDLILCDVMMPELDGFGVLKILNQSPKTRRIPFIFLTAKTDKSDFRKGMGLGADDYITKPFDDTELLEAVEMRLAKSEEISNLFDNSDQGLQRFFSVAKAQQEMIKLSENRELRRFQPKDLVYSEGQVPRWLFFLVSGRVKCFQTNEMGKELITQVYQAGDFFGHFSLFQNNLYSDNAKTMVESEIRLIPKDDFLTLLFSNRDFSAQFIKMIAKDALDTEEKLIDLAYSSVRKKVARALIKFAEKEGEDNPSIDVSREDLASMAGTAKETLIRTLSDFKSEGFIDLHGSHVTILDKQGLIHMPQ